MGDACKLVYDATTGMKLVLLCRGWQLNQSVNTLEFTRIIVTDLLLI